MKIRVMICAGLLGLVMAAASADDGAIPIFEQTAITESGHYVVTRNIITENSGPILSIHASALAVTIDLNGFFLWRQDSAGPVVDTVPAGDDRPDVNIRNGTIAGGSTGIDGGDGVSLTDVGFYDQGGHGVDLSSASSVYILNCKVANSGGHGIVLNGGGTNSVIGTVIRETEGTGLDIMGDGFTVRDCIIVGAKGAGISIVGNANRLSENVIKGVEESSPSAGDGHGVFVNGERNLVEGCLIAGASGSGIHFDTNASDNAYRNNMLLTTGTTVVGGASNRDAGGNIE